MNSEADDLDNPDLATNAVRLRPTEQQYFAELDALRDDPAEPNARSLRTTPAFSVMLAERKAKLAAENGYNLTAIRNAKIDAFRKTEKGRKARAKKARETYAKKKGQPIKAHTADSPEKRAARKAAQKAWRDANIAEVRDADRKRKAERRTADKANLSEAEHAVKRTEASKARAVRLAAQIKKENAATQAATVDHYSRNPIYGKF